MKTLKKIKKFYHTAQLFPSLNKNVHSTIILWCLIDWAITIIDHIFHDFTVMFSSFSSTILLKQIIIMSNSIYFRKMIFSYIYLLFAEKHWILQGKKRKLFSANVRNLLINFSVWKSSLNIDWSFNGFQ